MTALLWSQMYAAFSIWKKKEIDTKTKHPDKLDTCHSESLAQNFRFRILNVLKQSNVTTFIKVHSLLQSKPWHTK